MCAPCSTSQPLLTLPFCAACSLPQVINWLGQRLAEYPEGSPERVAALLDITQLENNKVAGVLQGTLANAKLVKELATAGHQVCAGCQHGLHKRFCTWWSLRFVSLLAPCVHQYRLLYTSAAACVVLQCGFGALCHLPHVTPVCDALVLLTPAAAGQCQPGAAEPLAVQGRH